MLLLISCEMPEPTIQVKVAFNQANSIDDASKVLLHDVKIGEVSSVTPEGDQVVIELQLNADKARAVQGNAAALIEGSKPASIVIYNPSTTATPAKEGDRLLGLNSNLELVAWQAGDTISSTVEQVSKAVSAYFDGQEWDQAKKDMNDLLGTLEQQSRAVHDDIARDFEDLIKNMETQSEQALEQAGKELKALTDKIKELHTKGSDEIARLLQQLVDELNRAFKQKQQATPSRRTI